MGEVEREKLRAEKWAEESVDKMENRISNLEKEAAEEEKADADDQKIKDMQKANELHAEAAAKLTADQALKDEQDAADEADAAKPAVVVHEYAPAPTVVVHKDVAPTVYVHSVADTPTVVYHSQDVPQVERVINYSDAPATIIKSETSAFGNDLKKYQGIVDKYKDYLDDIDSDEIIDGPIGELDF